MSFRSLRSFLCGQGESNSRIVLGKDVLYHLTMAAVHPAGLEPTITGPKPVVISISLRVHTVYMYFLLVHTHHTHSIEKKQKGGTMSGNDCAKRYPPGGFT